MKKKDKKNLKVVLVVLVIAIIGVLAWTGKICFDDQQKQESVANNKTENNASSNESKPQENEKKEEPKVEEPKKEEKIEPKEETSASNESKAIELAKKEYGITDGGVYYRIEQIKSNTEYIVSVSNKDTTVLAWYIVDVNAGTVKDY